jgi:hypothetical protein
VPCPAGRTSPAGTPAGCQTCDFENYYYNAATKLCVKRTVLPCNLVTHYEIATPLNQVFFLAPVLPCLKILEILNEIITL